MSSTMIGPNLVMTAAHCGTPTTVAFQTYRNDNPNSVDREDFSCKPLVNGFPKVDVSLSWCLPNTPGGPAPGDKYGYLDIDASPVPLTRGGQRTTLYSIWWNGITSAGLGNVSLHSAGPVSAIDTLIWAKEGWHNQVGPMQRNVGLSVAMWSNPGLCGRGVAGVYCALSSGSTLGGAQLWTVNGQFGDGNGWASPAYYASLRLADVNGDGRADLCGRGAAGINCAMSNGAGFASAVLFAANGMSDANGWAAPQYGSTIQLAKLTAFGPANVCGRQADGLVCSPLR